MGFLWHKKMNMNLRILDKGPYFKYAGEVGGGGGGGGGGRGV